MKRREMQGAIESFNEQYLQYESSLNTMASTHLESIQKEDERLNSIKQEIIQYEQNYRIFDRADEMMERVEDSLDHYSALLERTKSEAVIMESFMADLEEFKDAKREMEKELKVYNAKREKLQNVATDIQALFDLAADVKSKSEFLEDNASNIDKVSRRIDSLHETYGSLENQIREMQDYEGQISKSVNNIERVEAVANAIEKRLTNFQSVVERSENRMSKLKEYLQDVEEATHILKTKEHEISSLKDKFNELDSLSEYLEQRVNQIQAMIRKIENIRTDIDSTDVRLQEMFEQTDRKMQQFFPVYSISGT
jgi:exonuclease SbcC